MAHSAHPMLRDLSSLGQGLDQVYVSPTRPVSCGLCKCSTFRPCVSLHTLPSHWGCTSSTSCPSHGWGSSFPGLSPMSSSKIPRQNFLCWNSLATCVLGVGWVWGGGSDEDGGWVPTWTCSVWDSGGFGGLWSLIPPLCHLGAVTLA